MTDTDLDSLDMESRNRFLFCETCVDFIYDHNLDRLCGPFPKFSAEGESWTRCFMAYCDEKPLTPGRW